ncbi:hypothetical protein BH780_gp181 [Bacillus phage Eldridge]|uniref:Uncharacterized protein n=1 Tax=Bacillus phage Eldridge TaxID=1776293 RepID=A0A0Y0AIH4_9CAUD|nr:hypothetical protein BH780_gp181 [Bacillus phage Eldridge]AMB18764.1 hypothetical protein Eldridge_0184 [Bacillus phage Eldridge]
MFNILGKFFFFYMLAGSVWTVYNKHMYGQSNVGEYSTKTCVILALAITAFIEIGSAVDKGLNGKEEEK